MLGRTMNVYQDSLLRRSTLDKNVPVSWTRVRLILEIQIPLFQFERTLTNLWNVPTKIGWIEKKKSFLKRFYQKPTSTKMFFYKSHISHENKFQKIFCSYLAFKTDIEYKNFLISLCLILQFWLKPNYFKKQCSSSSFLLT